MPVRCVKPKASKEIEERVAAHFLTQPDHVRVAGIADAVHQRFRAVTGMVPTADGVDGGSSNTHWPVQVYVESSEATPDSIAMEPVTILKTEPG